MSEHEAITSSFIRTSKAQEAGHTFGITSNNIANSYCHNSKVCNNELGQLGRSGDVNTPLPAALVHDGNESSAAFAYTGGFPSSGHSAILDIRGYLWVTGCDRWQQLGLGSSDG